MTARLLLLLPPSETKRDGGNAAFGDRLTGSPDAAPAAGALAWPELEQIRAGVADDLVRLAADPAAAAKALKISAKLADVEVARDAVVRTSPRLAAARRYTGVLYDALDAASLDADETRWLDRHVAIHSALYGLVGAGEPIAAYRLSSSSTLPGPTLKRRWAGACAAALAEHDGLVVDLRSKGYVALGPAPAGALTIDVVTRGDDGAVRALNHFNKKAKGEFVRALAGRFAVSDEEPRDAADLVDAARSVGLDLEPTDDAGVLRLVAADPVTAR